ncbi:CPBP family intramembrane glutamic endopeptidase [Gramella sp. KN1008]|uniref:CPBP family intramembrane glutamic endopeptidase n=1 Tax=Gramella sp. KN1008 TaxID=2529298 RepID=UPI00103D6F64|nr:CPBP family intramembrane glutamic endopeptidase [Gramella sp. KN1008]TBW27922.1 CPBP family intramembrane metalloprotease [Gramella sp. KN1008]
MQEKLPARLQKYSPDQKNVIGMSVLFLLAAYFTLHYISHTFYRGELLDRSSPGNWLYWLNAILMGAVVYFNKKIFNWSWSDLGLAKPANWWQPVLVGLGCFVSVLIYSAIIDPWVKEVWGDINISHLYVLKQNLPQLIFALIAVWITAAFLEELVFRAFFINSLEILFGPGKWSAYTAVVLSAVVFGGIHAYQGISGIITTTIIGIIFGFAYIINGRRIWPLILVHGLVDSIALISIYNMAG